MSWSLLEGVCALTIIIGADERRDHVSINTFNYQRGLSEMGMILTFVQSMNFSLKIGRQWLNI